MCEALFGFFAVVTKATDAIHNQFIAVRPSTAAENEPNLRVEKAKCKGVIW